MVDNSRACVSGEALVASVVCNKYGLSLRSSHALTSLSRSMGVLQPLSNYRHTIAVKHTAPCVALSAVRKGIADLAFESLFGCISNQ